MSLLCLLGSVGRLGVVGSTAINVEQIAQGRGR